jgi:hypothetical protein
MAAATATKPQVMFSQRGYTCGPDSLFTILFEADGLRPLFVPYLEGSKAAGVAAGEPLQQSLALAIQRYRKMKAAGWSRSAEEPFRRKSANEGEGAEVLRILSECDLAADTGMKAGNLKRLVSAIIAEDKLGIPLSSKVFSVSLPTATIPVVNPSKVVGILLEFDQYNDAADVYITRFRVGANEFEEEPSDRFYTHKNIRTEPDRKHRIAGHISAFLKHAGRWYYADNMVGWLHEIAAPDFVEKHVLPALLDGSLAVQMGYPREEYTMADNLFLAIAAGGVVYTGGPDLLPDSNGPDSVIDWSAHHFGLAEAHMFVLKAMEGGVRRKTRRQKRRKHNRKSLRNK